MYKCTKADHFTPQHKNLANDKESALLVLGNEIFSIARTICILIADFTPNY